MKTYVIGIDYGTLSARCLLVDASLGEEICESVYNYPHGVMDKNLPSGEELPIDYALQDPEDYIGVLKVAVPELIKKAKILPEEIKGVGIDFTSCTMLPVDKNGTPLSSKEEFRKNRHAYVKLWKHHAAGKEAEEITSLAYKRGEKWLADYGGNISCEWALPKILEILREAPEIYSSAYRFVEAADWISLMLTGRETHSLPFAGYKWLYSEERGFPSNDFLTALDGRLDGIIGTKISKEVLALGNIAGYIDERGSALTSIPVGTPVALPMIDAHSAMPALGIIGGGDLMLILGTSSCQLLNSAVRKKVKGICGYVKDGVIPGLYTYEAGQPSVGDIFDWFVKNSIPASYTAEAEKKGVNIHKLLREKAMKLSPGESGLIALDWWNGNRSVLGDPGLSGMILGLTLTTRPEHIYRALIEATAFGFKRIVKQYESDGITIERIYAAGGIAQKDEMMMQIYSDVIGKDIHISATSQAAALGSAIYASVAAGIYTDVQSASKKLSGPSIKTYKPKKESTEVYKALYEEYERLYDYFGKDNDVMPKLKKH